MLAEQNKEQAVRFLSIALQQRETIHAPLAAGERHELEETLAQLRSDLGAAAFETEWQTGKELDSEDALLAFRTFVS